MTKPWTTLAVDEAGPVRWVTIDRPSVRNALNAEVIAELAECFAAWQGDPELRCVVLTGAGDKSFVAGADIAAMASMQPWQARAFAAAAHATAGLIESCAAPVIAAVNGFALGGGLELALCADFIYAADAAKMGFPEVGLGVIPGFGGTQRLATRVGVGRARELIYSGRLLSGVEAAAWGLANVCVPAAELKDEVLKVAEAIAAKAPLAVAEAKRAMRLGAGLPLERSLVLEQELFAGLFGTEDQKEGMAAFLAKRPPAYKGG